MTTTGAHSWIADFYDAYVTVDFDIPFFLEEARAAMGPVLELMAGTGRVSLPLAQAGVALTCVDLSGPMLARLRAKLADSGVSALTVEMDVAALGLEERDFALALLPFQAFGELLTAEAQAAALRAIHAHLKEGGRFICTLHNPQIRQQAADGQLRLMGTFPMSGLQDTLLLYVQQQLEASSPVVRSVQLYEVYDAAGRMTDKRWLDVRFRLVEQDEFQSLAEAAGFRVAALFGDYDRSPFQPETSRFMIWILER